MRQLTLRSLGLGTPRPTGRRTPADVAQTVRQLGYVQVDSVNVLARAHDTVVWTRLGPRAPGPLAVVARPGPPVLVEQWAHESCIVTLATARLLAPFPTDPWYSTRAFRSDPAWPAARARVWERLQDGPASAVRLGRELVGDDPARLQERRLIVRAAEGMFRERRLIGVGRTPTFERLLARRPQEDSPDPAAAALELMRTALRALGVARLSTLVDYWRIVPRDQVRAALAALQRLGEARQVEVGGTRRSTADPWLAWVGNDCDPLPPRSPARLVSPFDQVAAHRPRLRELFGVDYRIGIYTPAPKRTHGYYDLLLVQGERITARVDLRAERRRGALVLMGLFLEDGGRRAPTRTARAVVRELGALATWLHLPEVSIAPDARGDGVPALAALL